MTACYNLTKFQGTHNTNKASLYDKSDQRQSHTTSNARQVHLSYSVRVDFRYIGIYYVSKHMQARVVQVKVDAICAFYRKFNKRTLLNSCQQRIFAVKPIHNNVELH